MTFPIFISCSHDDKMLGFRTKTFINDLFRGKVDAFFFADRPSGQQWQEDAKHALINSKAIISLLTPSFRNKPWAFVEITPFWLAGKHVNVLCLEKDLSQKYLPVFQGYNFYNINSEEDILRFLKGIDECVNDSSQKPEITSNHSKIFIREIQEGIVEAELHKSTNYEYSEFVALRQYENEDYDDFFETLDFIYDDEIKRNIAMKLLLNCDFKRAIEVLLGIAEIRHIRQFAQQCLRRGRDVEKIMHGVLPLIGADNSELRNLAKFLINLNQWNSPLFDDIISRMQNNAEIRNICRHFINVHGFTKEVLGIVHYINNQAEIKNLLLSSIQNDEYDNPTFKQILSGMHSEKHQKIVLAALDKHQSK